MDHILKMKELLPGTYAVLSYEPTKSSYGLTYIITALHETNEQVKFFSNSFLSEYINSKKPHKKFVIECREGRVSIPGYSRIVNLI